jgi:hypothetical protein
VPVNPTIVAKFSTDVDAATVNNSSITMTRDYDNTVIPLTITVVANQITIVPTEARWLTELSSN